MFSNVTILGMIHKGNHFSSFQILEPYLMNGNEGAVDAETE
jgi:hypothetical protein